MIRNAAFLAFVILGSGFIAGRISSFHPSIFNTGPGRVSVRSEGTPLVSLLKELTGFTPVEKLIIAPGVEDRPVNLKIEDVPVEEAIHEILKAADVNYTVWGGNGKPFRIYAGLAEDIVPSTLPSEWPYNIRPRDDQSQDGDRSATGDATLEGRDSIGATDSAFLHYRPKGSGVALTMAILSLGLWMGAALVTN